MLQMRNEALGWAISSPVIAQCPAWQPSPRKKDKELWAILVIVILFIAINIAVPYVLYMMVMGFGDEPEDVPYSSIMTSESGSPTRKR